MTPEDRIRQLEQERHNVNVLLAAMAGEDVQFARAYDPVALGKLLLARAEAAEAKVTALEAERDRWAADRNHAVERQAHWETRATLLESELEVYRATLNMPLFEFDPVEVGKMKLALTTLQQRLLDLEGYVQHKPECATVAVRFTCGPVGDEVVLPDPTAICTCGLAALLSSPSPAQEKP